MEQPGIRAKRTLDQLAEADHRHKLESVLAAMPYHHSPEARALRAVLRKVAGRGEEPGERRTWRG